MVIGKARAALACASADLFRACIGREDGAPEAVPRVCGPDSSSAMTALGKAADGRGEDTGEVERR